MIVNNIVLINYLIFLLLFQKTIFQFNKNESNFLLKSSNFEL